MPRARKQPDPFAAYKLPVGLVEGVDIPLPNTDAVFTVRLPATMNEDFNMEMVSRLNMEPDEEGKIRVDSAKFQKVRKDLFFETCILGVKGIPGDQDEFFQNYPLAAKYVFDMASEMAVQADDAATDAMEKLKPMQNGKSSGVGVTTSTRGLSKRVSKSEPVVQT